MTPQERVDDFINNCYLFMVSILDKLGITYFYNEFVKDRVNITSGKFFDDPLRCILPIIYFLMGCYITYEFFQFVFMTDFLSYITNIILHFFIVSLLVCMLLILPFLMTYLISIFVEISTTLYLKGKITMPIILITIIVLLIV